MGQCATLPYNSNNGHHSNNNNNNSAAYYHNAVFKESSPVSAYAMQDATKHHHNHPSGNAPGGTESSHSVGNASENSNTPLMVAAEQSSHTVGQYHQHHHVNSQHHVNHNQHQHVNSQNHHHSNMRYVPPPNGAFVQPQPLNNAATPPRVPNSPANSSKKRKNGGNAAAAAQQQQQVSIPEHDTTGNNDLFEQVMIPFVPDGATPKRCFRLNLGQIDNHLSSPTGGNNGMPINFSMSEDSSVATNPNQMVESTAKIFRGLTVTRDGTVVSKNTSSSKSGSKKKHNHHNTNNKDTKSRQAAKIDKLKELVENTNTNTNTNNGAASNVTPTSPKKDNKSKSKSKSEAEDQEQQPENNQMLSLVVMGEYFDMKKLVRDGAKKLQAAEAGIAVDVTAAADNKNHHSKNKSSNKNSSSMDTSQHHQHTNHNTTSSRSPRSSSRYREQRHSPTISTRDNNNMNHRKDNHTNNTNGKYHRRYSSNSNHKSPSVSSPPKLNRHPRDPPRSAAGARYHQYYQPQCSAFGTGEGSDWSEALGFSQGLKSFWGCGGTGNTNNTAGFTKTSGDLAERRDEGGTNKYSSYGGGGNIASKECDVRMSAPEDSTTAVDEPMMMMMSHQQQQQQQQQRDPGSSRIGSIEVSMMH